MPIRPPEITAIDNIPLEHSTVAVTGVNLHVVQAGDPSKPLLILLHGFPEFWYGWRKQIAALVNAGFWLWIPDQRGYNLSDKPDGLAAYSLPSLARDVSELIDAAGREQAYIVGHDWGGAVAWGTALEYPERVKKLAILNSPHLSVMRKLLATKPEQLLRSWYIFFFQLPLLPEFLFTLGDAQGLMSILLRTSRPGNFTDADIPHYVHAWKQRGAMTAMLNWYRSLIQQPPPSLRDSRVHVPVLIQWGKRDFALTSEIAEQSQAYCDDAQLIFYDDATHWTQHDKADAVNAALIEFFRS